MITIGQAAEKTGLSPKMIRYYEQKQIFKPKGRSTAGYRLYGEGDIHSLNFIRSARDLGFSLKQIAALTDLWHNQKRSSAEVKKMALEHIKDLEQKAATLHQMAETLRNLAACCHGDDRPECPILDGIEAHLPG